MRSSFFLPQCTTVRHNYRVLKQLEAYIGDTEPHIRAAIGETEHRRASHTVLHISGVELPDRKHPLAQTSCAVIYLRKTMNQLHTSGGRGCPIKLGGKPSVRHWTRFNWPSALPSGRGFQPLFDRRVPRAAPYPLFPFPYPLCRNPYLTPLCTLIAQDILRLSGGGPAEH
jgi:hypothetical protein